MFMRSEKTKGSQLLVLLTSASGLFALSAQFYLLIQNGKRTILEAGIRYFSFFSIQATIIVTLISVFLLLKPSTRFGKFIIKSTTVTAAAVYITFVVLVYNIMLKGLWHPEGLQNIVDKLLHSVIPALFVLYWLIYTPKTELKWRNAFSWMLYPLIYTLLLFVVGAISNYYPYPFLDVKQLGYKKPIVITAVLFSSLFMISLLFVGIGKVLVRKKTD